MRQYSITPYHTLPSKPGQTRLDQARCWAWMTLACLPPLSATIAWHGMLAVDHAIASLLPLTRLPLPLPPDRSW
jgi:hypothetical protein